jgi:hypothetical protein
MSTTPTTPPVLSPDDAYAAFKQAEGALTADSGSLASAQAGQTALLAAQQQAASAAQANVDTAAAAVAADQPAAVTAANNLIASLQAFVTSNNPGAGA